MLAPALVVLSDHDTDAPELPGICTVSKDATGDQGGWFLGAKAAKQGRTWVDRGYFQGNPADDWIANLCRGITNLGGYLQFGNELNLPYEGWIGGEPAYLAQWRRVNQAYSAGNWIAAPPSPNTADWQSWVIRDACRLAVHAYGSCAEMREIVQWYLDYTNGDLYVTECNFCARKKGEGPIVDVNDWAHRELAPFLAWCNTQPRIKLVAYFAWKWDRSSTLQTPIDAKGTTIPLILAASNERPLGSPTAGSGGKGMSDYQVGPGVAAEIAKRGDTAVSDEQWIGSVYSVTYSEQGKYEYSKQANRVYFFPKA